MVHVFAAVAVDYFDVAIQEVIKIAVELIGVDSEHTSFDAENFFYTIFFQSFAEASDYYVYLLLLASIVSFVAPEN